MFVRHCGPEEGNYEDSRGDNPGAKQQSPGVYPQRTVTVIVVELKVLTVQAIATTAAPIRIPVISVVSFAIF